MNKLMVSVKVKDSSHVDSATSAELPSHTPSHTPSLKGQQEDQVNQVT